MVKLLFVGSGYFETCGVLIKEEEEWVLYSGTSHDPEMTNQDESEEFLAMCGGILVILLLALGMYLSV